MSEDWKDLAELTRLIRRRADEGRKVSLKPETARTVATHLQMYVNACEPHRELSFKLEQWDNDALDLRQTLALFRSIIPARRSFDDICAERPFERFMVRQGIRVIVDSGKPDPEAPRNVVRMK